MNDNGSINGNGKHDGDARTSRVVDVFRIREGESWFVRTLANEYGGLFTHFCQGKSRLCRGPDCHPSIHRVDRVWKGYTPVLVFFKDLRPRVWLPKVLEITAQLELDFRDCFDRGQEWELYRNVPIQKKIQPVMGKLHVAKVESRLPPAFDITNVVRVLYTAELIDLTAKNPTPRRTFVECVEGDAPAAMAERIASEEHERRVNEERMKALQERRRSPNAK